MEKEPEQTAPTALTLEQEFSLRTFDSVVDNMTTDQSKQHLKQMLREFMLYQNNVRTLAKENWFHGIDSHRG